LRYAVEFHGKRLMAESKLGLDLVGQPALGPGMKTTAAQPSSVDESYTIPVGKTSTVRDHYNALHADFQDAAGRRLSLEARVYDDGVAFRYLVPEQPSFKQVRIAHEFTEFSYVTDATSYPLLLDYQLRTVSSLHSDWLVGLPYLAEEPGLGWVAITEANIDNYAGMYLRRGNQSFSVRAELAPRVDLPGVAVEATAPFRSPWRVLMIGDEPGRLIEVGVGLVVGRCGSQRHLQDRHEHSHHEALHRLLLGIWISLYAHRRRLGSRTRNPPRRRSATGRHHKCESGHRHAGVAALRQGEERPPLAVGALDLGRQVHGPGFPLV
jgi:hypothetical protein